MVLKFCFKIVLKFFCRLLQSRNNVSTFPMILCCFLSISAIKKNAGQTDGPTDRRTDRPSYRDARTHLKSVTSIDLSLSRIYLITSILDNLSFLTFSIFFISSNFFWISNCLLLSMSKVRWTIAWATISSTLFL